MKRENKIKSIVNDLDNIPHISQKTLSVLNLTFTNGPATQHTILSDWTIKPEFVFDSDHLAIQ